MSRHHRIPRPVERWLLHSPFHNLSPPSQCRSRTSLRRQTAAVDTDPGRRKPRTPHKWTQPWLTESSFTAHHDSITGTTGTRAVRMNDGSRGQADVGHWIELQTRVLRFTRLREEAEQRLGASRSACSCSSRSATSSVRFARLLQNASSGIDARNVCFDGCDSKRILRVERCLMT